MGEGLPAVSIAKLGSEVGGEGNGKVNDSAAIRRGRARKKKKLCANFCFFSVNDKSVQKRKIKKKKRKVDINANLSKIKSDCT